MADPFQREAQLHLRSIYYPLGLPLHLKTNCQLIESAAEENWGGAKKLFDETPFELRVIVGQGTTAPPPPVYRSQAHLMTAISDAENFAVCDYSRNFAYCRLNEAAAKTCDFVAYYYLKALVNYAFAQLYLTPVHAACVAWNGRGILIGGESGAGKTTLAYACARKGWTFISDNESWLVRSAPGNLLVGDSRRIRFREDAVRLFPELQSQPLQRDATGKLKIEMTMPATGSCEIARVVMLSERFDEIPLYEDHVRAEHGRSLAKLPQPIELKVRDLDDAERFLRSLVT